MFCFCAKDYPVGPGVYLMHNAKKQVLYVGKAKHLVKRLSSYFRDQTQLTPKTRALVSKIAYIETLSTTTEKEALLLEAGLIKKHRPRYNIVLRDDKSYILFRLTKGHTYPRLILTRKVVQDGSVYYGPFTSAQAARHTWKVLGQAFALRKCGDKALKNRARPCLYYDIGQCLAPCVGLADKEEYASLVRRLESFLLGRVGEVQKQLQRAMQQAAGKLQYEQAAQYRDQLRAILATVERQGAVLSKPVDLDVLALAKAEKGIGLGVLFVRQGRVLDGKNFYFVDVLQDKVEILTGFLTQFYWKSRFIPERILLPWLPDDTSTLAEILTERRGAPVHLYSPRNSAEKQMLEMARANASQARSSAKETDIALSLAKIFALPDKVVRIECVDVSHLAGQGMRAGLVVFEEGVPQKSAYRTYLFPELEGTGDDYAALAAFARRRLKAGPPWPDLLLVDGGKGQIGAVLRSIEESQTKMTFALAGIAKATGEEKRPDRRAGALHDKIFVPGRTNPLPLKPGSAELLFLQKIRDEAHRFILGKQRASRKKNLITSELTNLPGIGPKTARLLWDSFHSTQAMRQATLSQMEQVPGLGKKRAKTVHDALKTLAVT